MAGKHFLRGLVALAFLVLQAQAKSVFAHFMLSNTAGFTVADYQKEIGLAQEAHIDGFAVNFSMDEDTTDSQMPIFFAAAESKGFKLFFSFDYAGNGAWPKSLVTSMINKARPPFPPYAASSAYFRRGGQPLVSTFEGPNNAPDWPSIKQETNCFFIPSFSSLGAKKAVATGVVDGLFSWAGWREGPNRMDTQVDASYMDYLGGLPYMMPVAPWFYTNMPGFKKNWLWKGDNLWFDRWAQVWYLQPEFVQIISWNDYGESHYIGPLDERQYTAFGEDRGRSPFNYVRDMPHDGWRDILPYVIDMYKNNQSTVTRETLTAWYRLSPAGACSDGGTTGNTVSQHQTEYGPGEIAEDRIYYTALLGSSATVSVSIGGRVQSQWAWDTIPDGGVGVYHGSVPFSGTGQVVVSLSRGGVSVSGPAITTDCSKNGGLTNWNAWVGSAKASGSISATPKLTLGEQVCIRGVGVAEFGAAKENFEGVCDFGCHYGYCPRGPCSCTQMGAKVKEPESLNIDAWPAAGRTCTYSGLCSFACNHKYCPDDCTTDKSLEGKCLIPQPIPEPEPVPGDGTPLLGCVAGKGEGNFGGLCGFSCGRGYCPEPCECTEKGSIVPPPATSAPGFPLSNMGSEYTGLCAFACARGYCPEGACTQTRPALGGTFKEYTTDTEFEKCKNENVRPWLCYQKRCGYAANHGTSPKQRWNAIPCQDALVDMFAWWELITRTIEGGNPGILPAWLRTSMPMSMGYAWGTPYSDENAATELPENFACNLLGDSGCTPISCTDLTVSPIAMIELSFANLKFFFQKQRDAVGEVGEQLSRNLQDIADTFVRPKYTFISGFKAFMEGIDQVMAFTGAGFWSMALSKNAFETFEKIVGDIANVAEAANTAVGAYELVAGEVKDRKAAAIENADDVKKAAETMLDMFIETLEGFLKFVYSGTPEATKVAIGLFSNGMFVQNPLGNVGQGDVVKVINSVMTARLITNIWATDEKCKPVLALGEFSVPSESRDLNFDVPWISKARFNHDNKVVTALCITDDGDLSKRQDKLELNVQPPYGLTELYDANNKFGIQWQDLARSAYDGWKANGEKWPYGIPKDMDASSGGAALPTYMPFEMGIRTPGFWQVPVCTAKNIQDNVRYYYEKGGPKCKDVFPCCNAVCTQVTTALGSKLWVCN